MGSSNEATRYYVIYFLIGQAHTQNDPCVAVVISEQK